MTRSRRPGPAALAGAGAAAVVTVLLAVVLLGPRAYTLLGLDVPGVALRVAVPVLRVVVTGAAAGCLGGFVAALLLAPPRTPDPGTGTDPGLSATGPASGPLRVAAGAATVWALGAAALVVATAADVSGGRVDPADLVRTLVVRTEPLGWLAAAVLAALVAVWAREVRTPSSGAGAAALAGAALLAPVVGGHTGDGVGHDIGMPATALHVVAATVWLGTLGAGLTPGGDPAQRSRRVARIAAGCAVVVVVTAVAEVVVLVPDVAGLASPYGLLVSVAAVLTLAAVVGRAARPRGGWAVELAVLGVVTGLSVALTRAVPPVQDPGHASAPEAVLGYSLTAPPTPGTLLTAWRLDVVFAALVALLVIAYARGLARVPGWPRGRVVSWFAGCAVVLVATCSGLGRYGPAVLSVHVAGHMLLSTVAPVLLVLGAPITLARRALTPAAPGAPEGPHEWLDHLATAPTLRVLTHPAVAIVLMVASPFLLYLTPAFALTQPLGWLQPLLAAWFLGVGYLFAWVLVGLDPLPRRPAGAPGLAPVARLGLVLASMPFHALLGVLLHAAHRPISTTPPTLSSVSGGGQVFVDDFYQRLRLDWAPDLIADQHLAGILTWVLGDVPLLGVIVVLLVQWRRAGAAADRAARRSLVGRPSA